MVSWNTVSKQGSWSLISLGSYVEDVTGAGSKGNFSFEKSDCEEWVAATSWNSTVYATCDTVDLLQPGMTMLEGLVLNSCPESYSDAWRPFQSSRRFIRLHDLQLQSSLYRNVHGRQFLVQS